MSIKLVVIRLFASVGWNSCSSDCVLSNVRSRSKQKTPSRNCRNLSTVKSSGNWSRSPWRISSPTTSKTMKQTTVQEDRDRVELIEELYRLDNRDDPGHLHHHTYTGLYQEILIYERWAREYPIYEKWKNRRWRKQQNPWRVRSRALYKSHRDKQRLEQNGPVKPRSIILSFQN